MWSNISAPKNVVIKSEQQAARSLEATPPHTDGPLESAGGKHQEPVPVPPNATGSGGSPLMRYKHAVCSSSSGFIYIHGGRFGNLPLDDDVWRFDPHQNSWLQLTTQGARPPSLQEHTLVEYNEQLYLFGGQVSASNQENSFWRLDLLSSEWHLLSMKSSKFGAHFGPTNRRGHSAVIYRDSMYIFGGFEDFRGSSAQLWEYDLLNQRWELRNLSSTSACHPEPRHSHSAIVYDDCMYIYGGLSNLKPLSDLWRWSWRDKRWYKERTRGRSPGQLHGHTAIQAFGSMFVFGGERHGRTTRSLWRLNLSNMSWQKIRPKGPRPSPTTWHGAIANPLSILDEANYIIEGSVDYELAAASSLSDNCLLECNGSAGHKQHEPSVTKPMQISDQTNRPTQATIINNNNSNKELQMQHSKSSSSNWLFSNSSDGPKAIMNSTANRQPLVGKKRKLRLSFLRKKNTRMPAYELKQIPASVSAANLINGRTSQSDIKKNTTNKRHSITIGSPVTVRSPADNNDVKVEQSISNQSIENNNNKTATPNGETNANILDNLDTDIKEMFQRALSSEQMDEMSMQMDDSSVSARNIKRQSTQETSQFSTAPNMTTATSRSQYQTANDQLTSSSSINTMTITGDRLMANAAQGPMMSQRTSYASYATPRSEFGSSTSRQLASHLNSQTTITDHNQVRDMSSSFEAHQQYQRPRAGQQTTTTSSGFNMRDNRPKSEIVQSLIDRADARIKHLYTPFFNQSQANSNTSAHHYSGSAANDPILGKLQGHRMFDSTGSNNRSHRSNHHNNHHHRLSLDKSKRHTIHQTMTYYNLYFNEDKSSSSPQTGSDNSNDNGDQQQHHDSEPQASSAVSAALNRRDDLSSTSTIKGASSTSAALIGVRDGSHTDRGDDSRLSLDTTVNNSSNTSRTIHESEFDSDNNHNHNQDQEYNHRDPPNEQTGGPHKSNDGLQKLSLQNVLNCRRDTTSESGDNTSLSFSAIAEFEEDDMLQYSSPTDPVIGLNNQQNRANGNETYERTMTTTTGVNKSIDESMQIDYDDDQYRQSNHQMLEHSGYRGCNGQLQQDGHHQQPIDQQTMPHKSASSGYASTHSSNFDQSPGNRFVQGNRSGPGSNATNGLPNEMVQPTGGASDTQEDSSVRTESSLAGCMTIDDTSPSSRRTHQHELGAARSILYRSAGAKNTVDCVKSNVNHPTAASSTTADSLALRTTTSEAFDNSLSSFCPAPSKSLPSSPPEKQPTLSSTSLPHQQRVPFMSKPKKFFSKKKSKNRYWQLCMFVIGGKQGGAHGVNEPITIWRLYI